MAGRAREREAAAAHRLDRRAGGEQRRLEASSRCRSCRASIQPRVVAHLLDAAPACGSAGRPPRSRARTRRTGSARAAPSMRCCDSGWPPVGCSCANARWLTSSMRRTRLEDLRRAGGPPACGRSGNRAAARCVRSPLSCAAMRAIFSSASASSLRQLLVARRSPRTRRSQSSMARSIVGVAIGLVDAARALGKGAARAPCSTGDLRGGRPPRCSSRLARPPPGRCCRAGVESESLKGKLAQLTPLARGADDRDQRPRTPARAARDAARRVRCARLGAAARRRPGARSCTTTGARAGRGPGASEAASRSSSSRWRGTGATGARAPPRGCRAAERVVLVASRVAQLAGIRAGRTPFSSSRRRSKSDRASVTLPVGAVYRRSTRTSTIRTGSTSRRAIRARNPTTPRSADVRARRSQASSTRSRARSVGGVLANIYELPGRRAAR